jgi:predicted helicase
MSFYFDRHFNGMTYQWFNMFKPNEKNVTISFNVGSTEFVVLASDAMVCQGTLLVGGGSTQCAPLYRFADDGSRVENITDWALGQFQKRYSRGDIRKSNTRKSNIESRISNIESRITKLDIFHYVYAVLHHPAYRAKYEINLKREFPRIPFYEDFWQWAAWGERLMSLHLNYEIVEPWPLERVDAENRNSQFVTRLIARKDTGIIEIDSVTTLRGVPSEAWEYRLGTYSALEWVLERYKEKKPKDPTIAEKFNTYRFADYKEQVIELLGKVCRVSVETMKVVKEMPE